MVGYQEAVEWDAPPTLPAVLSDAGYHTCMVGRNIHQWPVRKRYRFDQMVQLVRRSSDLGQFQRGTHPDIRARTRQSGPRESMHSGPGPGDQGR